MGTERLSEQLLVEAPRRLISVARVLRGAFCLQVAQLYICGTGLRESVREGSAFSHPSSDRASGVAQIIVCVIRRPAVAPPQRAPYGRRGGARIKYRVTSFAACARLHAPVQGLFSFPKAPH